MPLVLRDIPDAIKCPEHPDLHSIMDDIMRAMYMAKNEVVNNVFKQVSGRDMDETDKERVVLVFEKMDFTSISEFIEIDGITLGRVETVSSFGSSGVSFYPLKDFAKR